jgi:uncharacterized protein
MALIRQIIRIVLLLALLPAITHSGVHDQPRGQLNGQLKVREQEVKITGAGVELSGSLTLPVFEKERRAPALLLVSEWGSGSDEEAHRAIYRDIANQLSARGIAVLRYDLRCSGKSGCKPQSIFDDYVEDVTAVIRYLRQRPEIDPARTAILGHGFGGLIATTALLVSEQEQRPALLVLAAAPGRTGSKLVREQVNSRLARQGKSPPSSLPKGLEDSRSYLARVDALLAALETGAKLAAEARIDPSDALLLSLVRQPDVAMVMLTADPLRTMRGIGIPVLLLQGENDVEVTATDARYIAEALKRSGHSDVSLELVPGADHWFSPLPNAATSTLSAWLGRKFAIE